MKQRNPLAQHKTFISKMRAFIADRYAGAFAYKSDDTRVPLKQVKFQDVEFIGGLWRVQHKLDYELRTIRDKQLILGPRIDLQEKNYFEYYQAATPPVYNCYGPLCQLTYDKVVARYITDKKEYWAYGNTVADARAFLGIKLYDEYMDLIHSAACKKVNQNQK